MIGRGYAVFYGFRVLAAKSTERALGQGPVSPIAHNWGARSGGLGDPKLAMRRQVLDGVMRPHGRPSLTSQR